MGKIILTDEEKRERKRLYSKRWRDKNRDKHRAYNKIYYREHKEQSRDKHRRWRKSNPEKDKEYYRRLMEKDPNCHRNRYKNFGDWVDKIKSSGCTICGEKRPVCIDFHHKDPNTKLFRISSAFSRPRKVVEDEIKKCILLCANCHRIITYEGIINGDKPRL